MLGKYIGEVMWVLVTLFISEVEEKKKRKIKYIDQTKGRNIKT